MKKLLFGVAAALAMIGGAASAATLTTTTGTPLTYALHNPGGQADSMDAITKTKPGGYLVDMISSSMLHDAGSSGGFAEITGVGGLNGAGFTDLTIDPEDPILGFTGIKFNIDLPGNASDQNIPKGATFVYDATVYFVGGGHQDFLGVTTPNPQRYLASDPSQVMTKIVFSNLMGTYDLGTKQHPDIHTTQFNFDGIEQISFDAVFKPGLAPEPATWAMMLMGLGGLGVVLRRRRAVVA